MSATIDALREVVEDTCRANPHLTSRLEKAAFLVLLRPIEHLGGRDYRVSSEDGLRWYHIKDSQCECHDYLRHGQGHPCKHRLAVWLVRQLKGELLSSNA